MLHHELHTAPESFLANLSGQSCPQPAHPLIDLETTLSFEIPSPDHLSPAVSSRKHRQRIIFLVTCLYCTKEFQIPRKNLGKQILCQCCHLKFQTPRVRLQRLTDT